MPQPTQTRKRGRAACLWLLVLSAACLAPARAEARQNVAGIVSYESVLMAGSDLGFDEGSYAGSIGAIMFLDTRNPVLVHYRLNLGGARWYDRETGAHRGEQFFFGFTTSVGLGLGKGRIVMPFFDVGLGPQFVFRRNEGSKKVSQWGWTFGIQGQVGLMFRVAKGVGLRLGVGINSRSFYALKENLGGVWFTASILLGTPKPKPPEPPPDIPVAPPPEPGPPTVDDFWIESWIASEVESPDRPVLHARIVRSAGFDAQVHVSVVLADGSSFVMFRDGLEDPDHYSIALWTLGLPCGSSLVDVLAESGFQETAQPVSVWIPCDPVPGGAP